MSQTAQSLIQDAQREGAIGQAAANALDFVDIGANIQAALGVPADQIQSSEVILLNLLIDDSGSIRFAGNSDFVRSGVAIIIDSLLKTKQKDGILVSITLLNGGTIQPFTPIASSIRLDTHNYNPSGGTPLYDKAAESLGATLAKTQEFSSNGVPVRSITVFITDGNDESSRRQNAQSLKPLATDMIMSENHIVAAMGIADGTTDFNQVFSEMGLRKEWILTPGNSESEIRKAFEMVSQSAVRASQGGASFSQAAAGGFAGVP